MGFPYRILLKKQPTHQTLQMYLAKESRSHKVKREDLEDYKHKDV
jgi:hypothetical protein